MNRWFSILRTYGTGIPVSSSSFQNVATVSAGARLHLGLLDLGRATSRTFGGIGCILESPRIIVEALVGERTMVAYAGMGNRAGSSSLDMLNAETAVLRKFVESYGLLPTRVTIVDALPLHVGLGARTATTLAILVAAATANGLTIDADSINKLQHLSRRGRTSGIGIHGFFYGGWLIDAGQPEGTAFLPSGAQNDGTPSLLVQRYPSPDWPVTLFRVKGTEFSGPREVQFFEKNTPIPKSEVLAGLALLYHGMVPALLSGELVAFGDALAEFQDIGFKAREIAAQQPVVRNLMADLKATAPCVGMSSMGPLVFALGGTASELKLIAEKYNCLYQTTSIANLGWRSI